MLSDVLTPMHGSSSVGQQVSTFIGNSAIFDYIMMMSYITSFPKEEEKEVLMYMLSIKTCFGI